MDKTSVLVVGLEPSLIDFSEESYSAHPGLDAEVVRAALRRSEASLIALGFDARLCMIDFGETAAWVVKARLAQTRFDCVVIGAGLRLNARNTALFETVINIVHEHAPQAKLCFNTRAADLPRHGAWRFSRHETRGRRRRPDPLPENERLS